MNMRACYKNTGYSFVEVIVSITLLFFIITIFVGLFTVNIDKFTKTRNLLIGTYLAQTKLEELQAESPLVVEKSKSLSYREGSLADLYPDNPYIKDMVYKLEVKPFDSKLREVVVKIYQKEKLVAESWGLFPYKEEEWSPIGIPGPSPDRPSGAIAYNFDENYIYVISKYGDSWIGICRIDKDYLTRRRLDDAWGYGGATFIYTTNVGSIDILNAEWCPLPTQVNCNSVYPDTWKAADISWDRNRTDQFPGSSSTDLLYDTQAYPGPWPINRDDWVTVSNLSELWPQITTEYNGAYIFVAGKLLDSINKHIYNRYSSKWPGDTLYRLEAKALLRIKKSDWSYELFQDYSGDYWRQREPPLWPVNGARFDENGNFLNYETYNIYASGYTIQGLPDRPAECMKLYDGFLYYLSNEGIYRTEPHGEYKWWIRKRAETSRYGGASVISDYFARISAGWPGPDYKASPKGLVIKTDALFIGDEWRYYDWRTKVWQVNFSSPQNPIQLCQITNERFYLDPSLCIAVDNDYVYIGLTDCDKGGNVGSNSQGHIYRLPKGRFTGSPVDLTEGRFTTNPPGYNKPDERLRCISGLAVDDNYLYFCDKLTHRLYRMPKAGGKVYSYPVKDILKNQGWISNPYYLKIDGNYLYYINTSGVNFVYGGSTYSAPAGSLFRVPKYYSK